MQVGLIGAGNIARALARGWGDPVLCADVDSARAQALVDELGGEVVGSNAGLAERADLLVLCVKPAQLEEVAGQTQGRARAVASVLAGVKVETVQNAFPGVPIFRFMPNTAVEVRRGSLCYAAAAGVDPELEERVLAHFGRIGQIEVVPENLIDVAMAVMSVGPAYQALLAEAQVDAAVRHGLTPALANRLVAQTMAGTAELLRTRGYDTLAVRREVTSPAGVTARGLAALERAGVRGAFQDAADAVLERGR
jgi:pyrroline-5-carboxylate reductase